MLAVNAHRQGSTLYSWAFVRVGRRTLPVDADRWPEGPQKLTFRSFFEASHE
jgi:hypothetical protein